MGATTMLVDRAADVPGSSLGVVCAFCAVWNPAFCVGATVTVGICDRGGTALFATCPARGEDRLL